MDVTDITAVRTWALEQFVLGSKSIHGPGHWQTVIRHGTQLAQETSGADIIVIQLFALLHDCRRTREGRDGRHGPRAAEAARELRGRLIHLEDGQFELLNEACRDHTDGRITADPTIGCCWDADRLDLVRVGIQPIRRYLSTEAAKSMADH